MRYPFIFVFYLYADLLTLLEVLAWVGLGDRWKDPDTEIVPGIQEFHPVSSDTDTDSLEHL